MTEYLALVRHGETLPNVLVEKQADGLFYEVSGSRSRARSNPSRSQSLACNRSSLQESGWRSCSRKTTRLLALLLADSSALISRRTTSRLSFRTSRNALRITVFDKRSYGDFWNITYRGVQELHPDEYARFLAEGPLNYIPPGGRELPSAVCARFGRSR